MLSKYFVCFIIYSFFGWIYETIYCTLNEKAWENRGFLYGPCIPLYGVGAISAQFLFVELPIERFSHPSYLAIFFGCAIGSFILEYSTSYILEKRFHARWWDYSHLPLNINGRVCLIFTACFGIAGIIVTQFIEPPVIHVVNMMPQSLIELLALFFMFIFGFDMALTISALTSFAKEFERINEQINAQMAQRVEALYSKAESAEEDEKAIKERLSTEYVKQWIKHATATQRGQFRHIAKFTHPVASTKALLDKGSEYLRRRRK